MAKKKYQLHLKGYVGSWDFDADYVDYILDKNADKEVSVLIDSLGGQLNTALSISAAFKRHGNVHAHFVGMNASAATIASMGAHRVSMDHSAMYLVHQSSFPFFEYASLNSTGMETLIEQLSKAKTDLEKMDANVATMYARRCKKDPKALLELMKVGGWLTAKEALEWGFVDELTELEDEEAPVMTAAMAADFTAFGIPLPQMPHTKQQDSFFQKMAQALSSVFRSLQQTQLTQQAQATQQAQTANQDEPSRQKQANLNQHSMDKAYKNICKFLSCDSLPSKEGKVSLTEEQMENLECSMQANHDMIAELSLKVKAAEDENKRLTDTIKALEAKVASLQATGTTAVVDDKKTTEHEPDAFESFVNAGQSARELFESLP